VEISVLFFKKLKERRAKMDTIEIGKIIAVCLFAYLFGSIPFGYIISRIKGIDIQKFGSGNIGGTNIGRALGWKYALWVGGLDVWKGAVSVAVAMYFLYSSWLAVGLAFFFCLLGAILSIWLKLKTGSFRAGKGVAALIGGLLVLAGWQLLIIITVGHDINIHRIVCLFFTKKHPRPQRCQNRNKRDYQNCCQLFIAHILTF